MPRPPTEEDHARYWARFFAAITPEELLELAREMEREHPDDEWRLGLGESIANAVGMEWPELLDEL